MAYTKYIDAVHFLFIMEDTFTSQNEKSEKGKRVY